MTARNYIEKEKLREAREKAEEEEILSSLTRSSAKVNKTAGLTLSKEDSDSETIGNMLRSKIKKKAVESVKKTRRGRKLIPIFAGLIVVLLILFLQYNRLIFAPIFAYVSPGNIPPSEIEAVDPTIVQTVSPEPRIIIPKLNVDVPVHFGISLLEVDAAMRSGVAHYRIPGASAFPGEIGNLVITGHSAGDVYSSNQYKYIFSGLERLEDGDLIYVNYNSVRYTYRVFKKEVVEPTNVSSLVVETSKPILTLITCTPLGTSRLRLLVFAEQISPSFEGAETEEDLPTIDDGAAQEMPSNEPSFFEGIWNFLTGN
ncbi:class E sortase [Candidatus Saccharibacteria bacterium]|nr:class E sortase [Candidatus Saccharibacteria bacterium]